MRTLYSLTLTAWSALQAVAVCGELDCQQVQTCDRDLEPVPMPRYNSSLEATPDHDKDAWVPRRVMLRDAYGNLYYQTLDR